MKNLLNFFKDERGISTIEVVLIVVVLVGLVLVFKTQISQLVVRAFSTLSNSADSILK